MNSNILMIRIGLFLNFIGAILLALELIGAQRVRKAERFLKRQLSTIANPGKYYKAITDFLKQGGLSFLKKFLLYYLPSGILYAVCILLFDMLFGTAILRWVWEEKLIILYLILYPPLWFLLYAGTLIFSISVFTFIEGSLKNSTKLFFWAAWSGADIVFTIGLIIALPRLTMFVVLIFVSRIVFLTLLFIVLWAASLPLQLGFLLRKRYGFKSALPSVGIILLTIGFLLQFIGTF